MKWISTGENRDGGSPKEKRKQMDKYRLKQRAVDKPKENRK